eukprot:CAMPEP_0170520014 /NCGR_PEP_ID=MMETSP0209-20121228/5232_1 /TAXON_ID=665100 ORGANISM="Litonotus pictus, Strain P1" /NCGR_SAMPLE_ID=MMETSP0209 /ASSEMBLY_ACC=CAM_ASM_000301 /LENGTH=404 /DNA_ID=CAMNT_0010806051 /DNA_START=310 /DNA_END=1527 /DNA_ORIENTATION=+
MDSRDHGYSEDDIQMIGNIVKGDVHKFPSEKRYLASIVNNKETFFDLNKLSSMERDLKFFGYEDGYDDILLNHAKIIGGNLAFNYSYASNFYEFYKCYYKFERNLYNHRVVMGIDLMMQDIFRLTNKKMDYLSILKDPEELALFHDQIFNHLSFSTIHNPKLRNQEARNIMQKILNRDLYKFVGEIYVSDLLNKDKVTVSEYLKCTKTTSDTSHFKLTEEDILIKKFSVCYGKDNEDPVENAVFYYPRTKIIKSYDKEDFLMDKPAKYKEEIIRVYVKNQNLLPLALDTFKNFCNVIGLISHEYDKDKSGRKLVNSGNGINMSSERKAPLDFFSSAYLKEKTEKSFYQPINILSNLSGGITSFSGTNKHNVGILVGEVDKGNSNKSTEKKKDDCNDLDLREDRR